MSNVIYTADPVVSVTTFVASGQTLSFSDADYDYRYYAMVVAGSQTDSSIVTFNGQTMELAGTATINAPIYSLTVSSGHGVLVSGWKMVRNIFGRYGSSSEGLG